MSKVKVTCLHILLTSTIEFISNSRNKTFIWYFIWSGFHIQSYFKWKNWTYMYHQNNIQLSCMFQVECLICRSFQRDKFINTCKFISLVVFMYLLGFACPSCMSAQLLIKLTDLLTTYLITHTTLCNFQLQYIQCNYIITWPQ